MMRYFFSFLLLTSGIAAYAQNSFFTPGWFDISGYMGEEGRPPFSRAFVTEMRTDAYTKECFSYNPFDETTNISYLIGTHTVQLRALIDAVYDLRDFRYRIVENDAIELVPWSMLPDPTLREDTLVDFPGDLPENSPLPKNPLIRIKRSIVDLGSFNCDNKQITFQLYWTKRPYQISTSIINSKPIHKPTLLCIERTAPVPSKSDSTRTESLYLTPQRDRTDNVHYTDALIADPAATDVIIKTFADNLNQISQVYLKRTINGKTDTILIPKKWILKKEQILGIAISKDSMRTGKDIIDVNGWGNVTYVWETKIERALLLQPGTYEISIVPRLNDDKANKLFSDMTVRVRFVVLPSYKLVFSLRQVLIWLSLLLILGGIFFWLYKRYQRKKFLEIIQLKENARMQLAYVRSQLNPHFMFNALTGIQNLMNRKETEKAYDYLGKFARLTRRILDEAEQELVTIEEERVFLNDYLQMEQLRFGFQYAIHADTALNAIEIPVMLVQPFVENAVKHGVSTLKEQGIIQLYFIAENKDLIIRIIDNGAGFDVNEDTGGLGLQLSRDRIALLNNIYKETLLELTMPGKEQGAIIQITLHNWL